MTKQEFRQKLQELLFKQYTTKDEEKLALINQEIKELRTAYKLSLVQERTGIKTR